MDADFFAADMSDETALAKDSAEKNKLGVRRAMGGPPSEFPACPAMRAEARARLTVAGRPRARCAE